MLNIGDYVMTNYQKEDVCFSHRLSFPCMIIASRSVTKLVLTDNPYYNWVLNEYRYGLYVSNLETEVHKNIKDYFGKPVYWYRDDYLFLVEDVDLIFPNGFILKKKMFPEIGQIFKPDEYMQFQIAEITEDKKNCLAGGNLIWQKAI